MQNLRHYEVRLRMSRRRPYVVARWTLMTTGLLLVLFVFMRVVFLGV